MDKHYTSIEKNTFGSLPDGSPVDKYILSNSNGMTIEVLNYGGIITSLTVPDRQNSLSDIVMGFDTLDEYLKGHPYFGAIIGRFGNRIANAKFSLDGREYQLSVNHGPHQLHGGIDGFDKKLWDALPFDEGNASGLRLSYTSRDGEEGFPGELNVTVEYLLGIDNSLSIRYSAVSNSPTIINLTNHSYFNLNGMEDDIMQHVVLFPADRFLETDNDLIPTGKIRSVQNTAFDFMTPKEIGKDIHSEDDMLKVAGGYDHCYVLDQKGKGLTFCARVLEPNSGRVMEVFTTEPGFQFYTANSLGNMTGKGKDYTAKKAFCIETQHFPDSPNHPQFPSTELRPGEEYKSVTQYVFKVADS